MEIAMRPTAPLLALVDLLNKVMITGVNQDIEG
jgi:hypothetical protein